MTWKRLAIVLLVPHVLAVLAFAQTPPNDIAGHWAEGPIRDLVARRLVETFPDGTFRPGEALTRARYVSWLVAAKGVPLVRPERPTFADVPPAFPLAAHIEAAAAYGVLPPLNGRFRPDDPLTRVDAIDYTVRALGYTFESAYMANASLPFTDLAGLTPLLRGAIAVAALATPPLLREPPSPRLRPHETITRAEGAALLWGYLRALEEPFALRATFALGPAATLVVEKRGALRTLPVWRVQVGAFAEPERAARLAQALRARGFPVVVDALDALYKVRVGNFATRAEAETLAAQFAAEGMATWVITTLRDFEAQQAPFWTAILLLEPAAGIQLRPALAGDQGLTRARTSEIARRAGALAAVNGGFFAASGDPLGCLMIDGALLSEPVRGRSCVGIAQDGTLLFDMVDFAGSVGTEMGSAAVHGVNRARGPDELIVYRRAFGPSTRTNRFGIEAIVVGDLLQQVVESGNAPIPPDGYVVSGHGRSAAWMRQTLRPGDRVTLRLDLVPASGDPRWRDVVHVIGGGPRLLADGQSAAAIEGFTDGFLRRRHPRTAIARLADGRILLVVVDGREPYHSLGMTIPELAAMLRVLGAADAVNLDGGGSTTLVVRGTVVNLPSDETGERPVSDALLVIRP